MLYCASTEALRNNSIGIECASFHVKAIGRSPLWVT